MQVHPQDTFQMSLKKQLLSSSLKRTKISRTLLIYHPVSILEVPGKISERIIQARFNNFLAENNILKERQDRFRPYKGTSTTITTAYAHALADKKKKKHLWS